ncbi:MAG: molybdopterin-synthase adenylyltransferase MoeB [Candidatus Omnitrophica bacterium]|nr:molybdopterin-synthase adenylyltransferase MoeB [Candidatus Omnitrophota bacterium]
MDFTQEQLKRYSRHILLPDVGREGQEKIRQGKVLIIGIGGLGSPAALYLAAAGVGTLGLVDGDAVELSNLQRQVIHFTPDLKKPKVVSAKEKIAAMNPDVAVVTYPEKVTAANILRIISDRDYDFIIDGTDNFPAKFLINDACVLAQKPFSHGGILRFEGQTMTYVPGHACYRCLFDAPPPLNAVPSCAEAGVLGAVAGMLGTIQATEALKYLIAKGELLADRLLIFNALNMYFRTVTLKRNPACPVCGDNPTITKPFDEKQKFCEVKKQALLYQNPKDLASVKRGLKDAAQGKTFDFDPDKE